LSAYTANFMPIYDKEYQMVAVSTAPSSGNRQIGKSRDLGVAAFGLSA
jgi:hypothetical protein